MKRAILASMTLLLSACESKTEFGPCIGAFDDPDPAIRYRTSARNVALAVVFIETLVVPIVVVASETKCPAEKK